MENNLNDFVLLTETKKTKFYIGETVYNQAVEKAQFPINEYSVTRNTFSAEGYTVLNFMYSNKEDGQNIFDSFNLYNVPFKLIKKD